MTTVICDLDGVVYLGQQPIAGSADALRRLQSAGVNTLFATNNSTRTPEEVVDKIRRVVGVEIPPSAVVTSAMAAAWLLDPADSPALIVGGPGVHQALAERDIETTTEPEEAKSVVVGADFEFTYAKLADAALAIRGGARFVATNTDPTYPTEHGLLPGSGSLVAAVAMAAGIQPEVAGKPNRAIRELLGEQCEGATWVIGDRLDTDIAMSDWDDDWQSVVVLTGVTDPDDDTSSADHIAADLADAVDKVLERLSER